VLKPLLLSGSRGVIRADDPAAFLAAFRRIAALLHTPEVAHGAGDWGRQILVEDFIPGREIALEGILTRDGLRVLALFDKPEPLDGPYFEETIYVTPSRLPPAVQDAVAGCAARAAESIGLRHGPIHAELRLNEAGPWLVEVAARSIGGRCSRILRFGVDTSLEELILRHALGLPVPSFQREDSAAGVMMVPIPGAGRLRAVEGLAARGGQLPRVHLRPRQHARAGRGRAASGPSVPAVSDRTRAASGLGVIPPGGLGGCRVRARSRSVRGARGRSRRSPRLTAASDPPGAVRPGPISRGFAPAAGTGFTPGA
jgi:hypothetical protein